MKEYFVVGGIRASALCGGIKRECADCGSAFGEIDTAYLIGTGETMYEAAANTPSHRYICENCLAKHGYRKDGNLVRKIVSDKPYKIGNAECLETNLADIDRLRCDMEHGIEEYHKRERQRFLEKITNDEIELYGHITPYKPKPELSMEMNCMLCKSNRSTIEFIATERLTTELNRARKLISDLDVIFGQDAESDKIRLAAIQRKLKSYHKHDNPNIDHEIAKEIEKEMTK